MADLATMTAAQQASLVRTGKASATEVVQAALARVHALDPKVHAFITVMEEEALRDAREADAAARKGQRRGPLAGVPVAFKDNFETRGVRTTAGSRVLEDNVPKRDAAAVERLKQAGAIVIGKTHLHEFAAGTPHVFGDPHNPWDLERTPGGSSSGSAAAVAASMCPIAMGHDTGGSTRIPASWSGVVGMIGTYGLISRRGIVATGWSMDHAGPLTDTVEDMALTLSAIAGHDPEDPASVERKVPTYTRGLRSGIDGLRVGIPKEWFFDMIDPEVRQTVDAALRAFRKLGASRRQVSVPLVVHCMEIGGTIIGAEGVAAHDEWLDSRADKYGPLQLRRLRAARFITGAQYVKAQRLRRELRGQFLAAFANIDIMVTPTTPTAAIKIGQREFTVDGKPVKAGYLQAGLTYAFDITGFPALSLPCGFTKSGLPIGVQIIGRPFSEATVLRAAHAYEQATEWHKRRPPLEP